METKRLDVHQIGRRLESKWGINLSPASIYRLAGDIPLIATGPKKALRALETEVDRWAAERCGIEVW